MTRSAPSALFALVLALLVLGCLATLAGLVVLPFASAPGDAVGLLLGSAVVASTRSVLALRPFGEFDWMGYGGATRAPDGRAPMIAEVPDVTVIADALGVEVTLFNPATVDHMADDAMDHQAVYRVDLAREDGTFGELNRAYSLAVFVAAALPATLNGEYLKGIGFRRVGGV